MAKRAEKSSPHGVSKKGKKMDGKSTKVQKKTIDEWMRQMKPLKVVLHRIEIPDDTGSSRPPTQNVNDGENIHGPGHMVADSQQPSSSDINDESVGESSSNINDESVGDTKEELAGPSSTSTQYIGKHAEDTRGSSQPPTQNVNDGENIHGPEDMVDDVSMEATCGSPHASVSTEFTDASMEEFPPQSPRPSVLTDDDSKHDEDPSVLTDDDSKHDEDSNFFFSSCSDHTSDHTSDMEDHEHVEWPPASPKQSKNIDVDEEPVFDWDYLESYTADIIGDEAEKENVAENDNVHDEKRSSPNRKSLGGFFNSFFE